MTSGTNDERRQASEPTFADAMNGFSFNSVRAPRRRRWGRRRGQDPEQPVQARTEPGPELPLLSGPIEVGADPGGSGLTRGPAAVRPYAWTRGRTKSGLDLAIEALVSTSQRGREQMAMLQVEYGAVAELCEQTRSVAEVAALLKIPLGVARVLLGDMAGIGVVTVHQTASSTGNMPDLALMERVLRGLRRL